MNKLLPIALIILIIISISNLSIAQKSNQNTSLQEKKTVDSAPSTIGFKNQSSNNSSNENQYIQQNSNKSTTNIQSTYQKQTTTVSTNSNQTATSFSSLNIDFNKLPIDVQQKINSNKLSGKNLLDGIAKAFTVEVKVCNTIEDEKKMFSFLTTKNGFINSEFIAKGLVRIIVEPTFDSVELKELMLSAAIDFNFLNEYYLIKK